MIDFHTHQPPVDNDSSVRSLLISEVDKVTPHDLFTIGIHPWFTEEVELAEQFSLINEYAKRSNVIGIGEIGLDKHRGGPIEKQIEVFEKQAMIAEKVNKPIVIHCVRAWAELLEARKRIQPKMPWAIHGFRGQSELVKQLLGYGMYISFGPESLNASEGLQEAIRIVPMNRLFIETDDADVSLKYLYTTISKIKSITTRDLEENINFNFAEFFGR